MNDRDSGSIVHIENLEKTYVTAGERLTVLHHLNMDIRSGTKCVIVGKSGSGKSTLLNIIGGLDSVTSGEVIVGGNDISLLGEDALAAYRRRFLGLVFQFHYLLKDFSALENVFLPLYMAGMPRKHAMSKARALLADVGLTERAEHLPAELSGGERQRVAVARCLVNDPSLILADEPTGNLDPVNAALIGDLLFSMADKYHKTLILVTHDMNVAAKGDVRYFIKDGALAEDAS